MLRPAVHAGFEEGSVDDQLTPALEQVEQARFALGPVEHICLFHGNPRHPPAFGGQRVMSPHLGLLLHEQLLARSLPRLRRNNRWRGYRMSGRFRARRGGEQRGRDQLFPQSSSCWPQNQAVIGCVPRRRPENAFPASANVSLHLQKRTYLAGVGSAGMRHEGVDTLATKEPGHMLG